MQQGCPSVGQDPPSVPQAGSVITPGMAAGALLTLCSFPVILSFFVQNESIVLLQQEKDF